MWADILWGKLRLGAAQGRGSGEPCLQLLEGASPYMVWMGLRKPSHLRSVIGSLTKDGSPTNDLQERIRCVGDGDLRLAWVGFEGENNGALLYAVDRAAEEMFRGNLANKTPRKDAAWSTGNYFLKYYCLLIRMQNDAATLEV